MRSIANHQFGQAESVWLFGKGPSLQTFDVTAADGPRICINESLLLVDNPTYFFAHDERPIRNVVQDYPEGCIAILEIDRAKCAADLGIPKNQILVYEKQDIGSDLDFDSAGLLKNGKLIGNCGTVHSAIHFCKLFGAKAVNMVGFEGKGEYASKLNQEMPIGGGQHARIRGFSKRLLNYLGFQFQFLEDSEKRLEDKNRKIDYLELYDRLRQHGYHGDDDKTTHLKSQIPWITKNIEFESVLDIGCSTGASLELFENLGKQATGLEISNIAVNEGKQLGRNVVQGCATKLPFADSSFDLVVSADVFEHLRPEDGIKAAEEACRVARKCVFLKIAEHEDATEKWKQIAGHPLHLTTEPIDWWKAHLIRFGKILRCERELIGIDVK